MKKIINLSFMFLLFHAAASGQPDSTRISGKTYPLSRWTLEPGIGLKPYPVSDFLVSNVLQWNIRKKFSLVSYTSYAYNNAFLRRFNYIKTDYNFSLTQKLGIGTSFYSKAASHTFSLLGGIQYDSYKETLEHPDFEKVSFGLSSVRPDIGLMYNLKVGKKKYFFSYRMYLPLYPYPFLTSDINAVDGNMANISLELGLGIRLK
ncbi:MAG: hypothetical protein JNL88_04635 [Bacteroidia bacterium]|nr:hypothetical protein [Bacteroidia bacterium]